MQDSTGVCEKNEPRPTARDGLIGAAVMIGATVVLVVLGIAARGNGWVTLGEVLKGIAFPAALVLSLPFWLFRNRSWRTQAIVMGPTLVLLIAIAWLSTRF
jgi:hypothetical protein